MDYGPTVDEAHRPKPRMDLRRGYAPLPSSHAREQHRKPQIFPRSWSPSSPFPNPSLASLPPGWLVQLASPPHRTHTSGGRRAHFPPSERYGLDQGSSHSFSLSCGRRRCCRSCAASPVFPQNILRETPEPFPRRQRIRLRAPAGAVPLRPC
jgi:hypothetical protein